MMSYSDYDSDDYSSDQDKDYVPSDDNLSEDDINQCEKEDPINEDDDVPHADNAKKKKRKDVRNRKMGAQRLKKMKVEEEEGEAKETQGNNGEDDTKQKKKSDDLWASFLSDVGSRPKDSQSAPTAKAESEQKVPAASGETEPSGPAMVTITKVFDFAGEEVRVSKEVSADSKEAKSFLKSQNTEEEEEENGSKERSPAPSQPPLPGPSAKRPAGISNIMNRFGGKKQKMSTLEKSKMDWDAFKSEEGITEELAIHNRGKEGYVERKNFLDRVDHRRFELEKAVRLSNMKQ
ncbi:craniofacial development protein 1 [Cololabis saira]|uniref:craniofacial development protein 1 n=1 Tax=Cololabis saira TaxID=129043 RepID=UPI002AD2A7F6|nr:craniofacial development protein 1 [Cololabis saira]